MRYQQLQRENNKTDRQRFEYIDGRRRAYSHECLYNNIINFKKAHAEFAEANEQCDWNEFLDHQNTRGLNAFKRLRTKGVTLKQQKRDLELWTHIIQTFKGVVKLNQFEPIGPGGRKTRSTPRYKNAWMCLDNVERCLS